MIRVFDDNKNICECCDNDSEILINFVDTVKDNLKVEVYLCKEHKEKLVDILLPFQGGYRNIASFKKYKIYVSFRYVVHIILYIAKEKN